METTESNLTIRLRKLKASNEYELKTGPVEKLITLKEVNKMILALRRAKDNDKVRIGNAKIVADKVQYLRIAEYFETVLDSATSEG